MQVGNWTPLSLAAVQEVLPAMRLLIELGAGVDAGKKSPLARACGLPNTEVVKLLLDPAYGRVYAQLLEHFSSDDSFTNRSVTVSPPSPSESST